MLYGKVHEKKCKSSFHYVVMSCNYPIVSTVIPEINYPTYVASNSQSGSASSSSGSSSGKDPASEGVDAGVSSISMAEAASSLVARVFCSTLGSST